MRSRILGLPLAALCLLGKPAFAQLTTYHDQAAFLSAAGATTMESFEELAPSPRGADPISVAAFTVTPEPGLIGILDGPADGFGASATDGTKFLLSYRPSLPAGTLRFDLAAPTTAFGFFLIDDGETDGLVSLHTNAGETLGDMTVLQAPPILPNGNVAFFGFVQSTPFSQVFLTSTGIDDSFGLDQVYTAAAPVAVPEPGMWLIGAAALLPGIRPLLRRPRTRFFRP